MRNILLFAIVMTLPPATLAADPFPVDARTVGGTRELQAMASFFEGTFESVRDGQVNYVPVKLRHARLWTEREGEYWYYAEYTKAGDEANPIRQRLYRLGENGGALRLVTYELPRDPKSLAGEWRKPKPFAGVDPAGLKERLGCRVSFDKQHFTLYMGGPVGKACPADIPPAVSESTDFFLTSSSLRTWTKGFDGAGKEVWKLSFEPLELRRMAPTAR